MAKGLSTKEWKDLIIGTKATVFSTEKLELIIGKTSRKIEVPYNQI